MRVGARDEVQGRVGGVERVEGGVLAWGWGSWGGGWLVDVDWRGRGFVEEELKDKGKMRWKLPRNMTSASGPVPVLMKKVSCWPSLVAISL